MASDPITSWQIDGETVETVTDFIFLGSKITVDGDCSHEIKRCLFLGRKAMTNLDSILKSRNIILPAKVCVVKATSKTVGVARGHQRADTLKPYSQKTSQSNHTRTTTLSNSMKLSHACGATQDRWVMVERPDRMWFTGEGNGKPLQYSYLESPMNSVKRQKDRTLKDELPRWVDAQYATGDQWRNNSRKNEGIELKQKQHPVVYGTDDRSKVQYCKEQYCIGTWNVRSISQGKLEVVKQEMARVNIYSLGIR